MNPVVNPATGTSLALDSSRDAAATARPCSTPAGRAAVRPRKRRDRGRNDNGLKKRIETLASRKSEFKGNPRKSSGLLDAFIELFELMASEPPASSSGFPPPALPRQR